MIPSSRKFPLRTQFLAFRSRAQKFSSPLCTTHYLPVPQQSRLAVIIPKKVSNLATTRNWLRRLTYDTLWPVVKDKRLDLVVVYKPLPLQQSPQAKQQIISSLTSLVSNI